MISEEEKKTASTFEQLGRKYVEVKGDSVEDIFKEYIDAIKISEEKISEYQKKIVDIKGISKCPSCGAEVPNGSLFCAVCGAKIQVSAEQSESNSKFCDACGAAISEGSKFCTSCGKAVE